MDKPTPDKIRTSLYFDLLFEQNHFEELKVLSFVGLFAFFLAFLFPGLIAGKEYTVQDKMLVCPIIDMKSIRFATNVFSALSTLLEILDIWHAYKAKCSVDQNPNTTPKNMSATMATTVSLIFSKQP